jgi:hypothetical protein
MSTTESEVREAEAKASKLRDLFTRGQRERAAREKEALALAAEEVLSEVPSQLREVRDAAEADLETALADPTTSLQGLQNAWSALRIASHVHFEVYRQAAGNADSRRGIQSFNGVERSRFPMTSDPFAGLTWERVQATWLQRRQAEALTVGLAELERRDADALARVTK